MLNFLKKKSKTVFLFFFALLLSVAPLLNFSTPASAAECTGYKFEIHKNGSLLPNGTSKCYSKEEINGKSFSITVERDMPTSCNATTTDPSMWEECVTVTLPDNRKISLGVDKFLKDKAKAITQDNLAIEIGLWEYNGGTDPVRKLGKTAKFEKNGDGITASFSNIEIGEDGSSTTTTTTGDGGTTTTTTTAEEGAEDADARGSEAAAATGSKTIEKKCKNKVGVLGWILCPLTLNAAEAVNNLYQNIQKNYMNVRPKLFSQTGVDSSGSPTSSSLLASKWGDVRNWANMVFIILFFIIILSQLTGVGIDNYGIKRILPRLIVSAILINLSYIICQLAVDVSNIVGSGLVDFLNPGSGGTGVTGDYIPIDIAGGQARISIENLNAGILVIILLCLVVALLATIILWIFCLVRDIGIVVATCLSPLAFAANLLPNTEGFFKKWWSLSKILITLFPICALAVGAGTLVSHILSEVDGTWLMQLAAVLAATLPFVAIPYLLLNMLSAFGTIGNKISNWGRGKLNAGWRAAGRPVSSTTKMAARGAARVAGSVAGLPLGITKDALKKVSQSGAGKSVSGAVKKYNPGALSQKVGKAYSKTKFGSSETGKAVSQLVNAPVSAVKDTAKEAFESTKYAIKKPFADTAKADAERRIERTNIDNWTNPVRRAASEAAMTSKQQADDIKARESLIQSDRYSYRRRDASGNLVQTTLDHSSITQLGEALRYVMSKNYTGSESDRKSDIAALNNRLFALGDKGRTESANAYNYVTTTTDANGNTLASRDGVLAYGQNVMDYHAADAKQNQRAIYEVASRVVSDNASNATTPLPLTDIKLSDFAGRTAGKLKLEQYATMDDIEVERIEQAMNHQNGLRLTNGGTQAEEDAAKAATLQAIHSALNDKQISSMLKGERRVKLQQILDDHSGQFTPLQQEPTRVLVVNHGNQQGSQGNGANNGGGGANP